MNPRSFSSAALVVFALGGVACGSARKLDEAGGQVLSTCTGCHGGQDNLTGAPPTDLLGRSDPSLRSVGAHTAHVQAGALAGAFDCGACHVTPAALNAPGHGNGIVEVTFGPFSTANGTVTPSYDAQRGGCASTYCHGAFPAGNPNNIPLWTAGSSASRCGSCHGDPAAAASALPRVHVALAAGSTNATCNVCHPATVKADGSVDGAGGKHVNGAAEVDAAAVHPAAWMDTASLGFHGLAATTQVAARVCLRCHAVDAPAHVTTVTCNGCHDVLGFPIQITP